MTPQQLAFELRNPHALDAWYVNNDDAVVVSLPKQWEVKIQKRCEGYFWTVYNADGVAQYGDFVTANDSQLAEVVTKLIVGLRRDHSAPAAKTYTLTLTETEAEAVGMAIRRTIRDFESQEGAYAWQNVALLETAYAKLDHSATKQTN